MMDCCLVKSKTSKNPNQARVQINNKWVLQWYAAVPRQYSELVSKGRRGLGGRGTDRHELMLPKS